MCLNIRCMMRSTLLSTSIALLISMSALQKFNISVVNQNDMLIKQKTQVFIANFFNIFGNVNMFYKLKQIRFMKSCSIELFIEKT